MESENKEESLPALVAVESVESEESSDVPSACNLVIVPLDTVAAVLPPSPPTLEEEKKSLKELMDKAEKMLNDDFDGICMRIYMLVNRTTVSAYFSAFYYGVCSFLS